MAEPVEPLSIAMLVAEIFDELQIPYTIGGSIASTMAGEPRSTVDVDFVAALSEAAIPELTARLAPAFYVAEDALRRAVRDRSSANLIHHDTSIKIDVFVAGGTPLDAQQIARRRRVDIGGRTLYVHPPEDILLQKLRWFRQGGEVSDRQWRDILGIIRTQGRRLDREYLSTNAPVLGVGTLLERAFREAGGDT